MRTLKNKKQNFLFYAFSLVFKDSLFVVLALSLTLNILALYYFLLYRVTTLEVFLASNTPFYNWASIVMTLLISIFFGIAMSLLIFQWRQKTISNPSHTGNTLIASFLGALSAGCPVCGGFLISLLGIGGGLMAFPFQGLEIKAISLGLLSMAIISSTKSISRRAQGICEPAPRKRISPWLPAIIGFSLFFVVLYLPAIADRFNFRISFQPSQAKVPSGSNLSDPNSSKPNLSLDSQDLFNQINPSEGYTINASYGDIGPKLLAVGAIDLEKMKSIYQRAGQPLTDEQIKILTQGSKEKIKITPENAYFLLNFLWAMGLANKNPILEKGPMVKYGKDKIGYFASTGGWTLGKKKATDLYSRFEIVKLNPEQQKILEEFAFGSYRPCCSNPTGFPDCNHGMAALALGEIMAANGASAEEIFEAFKYFNAFWFPQVYFDIAKYFKAKEGKNWKEVPGRIVAGKNFSTPQGWSRVRNWLKSNNLIEQAPSRAGSGCGV